MRPVASCQPLGIYQGKPNINTLKLVAEEGGFLYRCLLLFLGMTVITHSHERVRARKHAHIECSAYCTVPELAQ